VAHPTKILSGLWPTLQRPPPCGLGSAVSSPAGSGANLRPQSHFAVLYARKTHLAAAFLVLWPALQSSGKMKANSGSGRI